MTERKSKVENSRYSDILIIGGGPGGIQAARMIKSHSPKTEVTVLRPEFYSLVYCAIPYAIESLFPVEKIFKSDELITDVGGRLIREKAVEVDLKKHRVLLADGRSIGFGKLLIVTGAVPFKPPLPGIDLKNIFTVKTIQDTEKIIKVINMEADCDSDTRSRFSNGARKAVVIGAGTIGIEQALSYLTHDIEVHLVEMKNYPLSQLIDADMAKPITEKLEEAGVNFYLGTRLVSFQGNQSVSGVKLSDGKSIGLEENRDFAVVSIGMRPDIDLFKDIGVEIGRDGIIVDEYMRTNIDNVWAAGDCVEFYSGIDHKTVGGKLATNAVPMAKVAALDMLGKKARYPGFYNGAVTMVGNLRVGGTGFTERFAQERGFDVYSTFGKTLTRFPMMPGAGKVQVKLIFDRETDRLLGGQVIGIEAVAERIDLLTLAIQHRLTAYNLADLSYSAQPWQTFFPARNAIVEASMKAIGLV